jgi:hypothetical protein
LSNILQTIPLATIGDHSFELKYQLKYSLPQVRFRILDEDLYICGLSDITLCIDEFEKLQIDCQKVYIVENKITTLSFPAIKNSIVIFGSGYSVGVLKKTQWLQNKEIFYWGDIDIDGFAILSQVRGYFPHTKSICMDEDTIKSFKQKAIKNRSNKYPILDNLDDNESIVYERLINDFYGKDFRLEQEMIPLEYFYYF